MMSLEHLLAGNDLVFVLMVFVNLFILVFFALIWRTSRRREQPQGQQISGTSYIWDVKLDGIELVRDEVVLWGTKRWLFSPDRALIGERVVPLVRYEATIRNKGRRIPTYTLWAVQADGSRVSLLQHHNLAGPWRPLETALKSMSSDARDWGSEDDVPPLLDDMRQASSRSQRREEEEMLRRVRGRAKTPEVR